MIIDKFCGGSTIQGQSASNVDAASEVVDFDLTGNTLYPMWTDAKVLDAPSGTQTLFYEDCCPQFYDSCVDVVRVSVPCIRYFRTGANEVLEESTNPCEGWQRSGFPCPDVIPTMAIVSPTETSDKVILRQYAYAWVKSAIGVTDVERSMLSPISVSQMADWDNEALIGNIPVPPAGYGITGVEIYSTGPQSSTEDNLAGTFFKVAELPIGTTAFVHKPASMPYGDPYLIPDNGGPPPDRLYSIQQYNEVMLGGLSEGKLYFTEPKEFHKWPLNSALTFASKPLRFVISGDYGYVLTCEAPEVIDLKNSCPGGKCKTTMKLDVPLPLVGPRSIVSIGDGSIVYASSKGLVRLSGTKWAILDANEQTRDSWLSWQPHTLVGAYHDGYYYGFGAQKSFRIPVANGAEYGNPRCHHIVGLSIQANHAYSSLDGRLYFVNNSGVYEMGAGAKRKTGTWTSNLLRNDQIVQLKTLSVDAEQGNVLVDIMDDCGNSVTTVRANPCQIQKLPRHVDFRRFKLRVTSDTEVSRISIGQPYRK